MSLILRSTITISWCLFLVLDTNNLLFWLYIHVPATIEFCFVVSRIPKCQKYSLLLPSSVIGERNGGVVALELKLVVSVTMPSGSAEIAVPAESVMFPLMMYLFPVMTWLLPVVMCYWCQQKLFHCYSGPHMLSLYLKIVYGPWIKPKM